MSTVFSRRSFLKYTAVAAVAVAGSSLLSGCEFTNSNRPTGSTGDTLSVIGNHELVSAKLEGTTLTCEFKHTPNSIIKLDKANYEVRVISGDKTTAYSYANGNDLTITGALSATEKGKTYPVTMTLKGIEVPTGSTVQLVYHPRYASLLDENDSYADVYATWDISKAVVPTATQA